MYYIAVLAHSKRTKEFYSPDRKRSGLFYWWNMNITLGDTIKIDGEEVPEYLLKALYECLKNKYAFLANNSICSDVIQAERLSVNGLKIPLDAITYPWNK